MASLIKNQNVTENGGDNILRKRAIELRWERSLYQGLDRGRKAEADLMKVERILVIRTGRAY